MLFQVNFKYPVPNGTIRSASLAIEAKDIQEANKKASDKLAKQYASFKVTSTKEFQ